MERILSYIAEFDGSIEENLKFFGFSGRICTLLKKEFGLVKNNGVPLYVVDKTKKGDVITIMIKEEPSIIKPYEYEIDIVYEDCDIAVIDKPSGIATISTFAHYDVSLMNALASKWGNYVYHPVNRLDKGTSGLMLVAKHCLAHSILNAELAGSSAEKAVQREYQCIIAGDIADSGIISEPIAHIDKSSYRRVVDKSGKSAVTYYELMREVDELKLLRVKLATGRTHQIRTHLSHIGCPLLGDELYGGDIARISRPALHSASVKFTHPITKEIMSFNSELPDDMACLLSSR